MSSSPTYADLKKRLEHLADSFLPKLAFDGRYAPKEIDSINAFVIMSHAEVEYFCEEIALEAVLRAERRSKGGKCDAVISRLILFYSLQKGKQLEGFSQDLMRSACKHYRKLVSSNHGVKTPDILKLFLPLGLTHQDFDDVFLANLDTFGVRRGGLAHRGGRINQGANPEDERKLVYDLLPELSRLYQLIRGL